MEKKKKEKECNVDYVQTGTVIGTRLTSSGAGGLRDGSGMVHLAEITDHTAGPHGHNSGNTVALGNEKHDKVPQCKAEALCSITHSKPLLPRH